MIEILSHDPMWIVTFEDIRKRLWPEISSVALAIEHIGSTSVFGLHAKPIVDIAIVVDSKVCSGQAVKILESLGYQHRGDLGIKDRESFKRPEKSPRHNLYVTLKDSLSLRNHLALKRLLIERQDLRDQYSALKWKLAAKCGADMDRYCELKTEFILECLVQCDFSSSELNEIRKANNISGLKMNVQPDLTR